MIKTNNTDNFSMALNSMANIMEKEKTRREALGQKPTENQLLKHLAKTLETYEDEYIKPIPKNIADLL